MRCGHGLNYQLVTHMLTTQHQKLKEKTIGARKRPHKNTQKKNKTFNKFKTNSNEIKVIMLHRLLFYLQYILCFTILNLLKYVLVKFTSKSHI